MVKFVVTVETEDDVEVSLEASSKEEALANLDELLALTRAVAERLKTKPQHKAPKRRGKSEAVKALEIIEQKLIPSSFFSTARTTAEVRQKIIEQSGLPFQSRKVSQALGILYDKGTLTRVGQKGNYRWILPKSP
ncbi:MAG: hypothetical protein QXE96_00625 [Candidatus Caldarchaeum sp.]|jgi:transposase